MKKKLILGLSLLAAFAVSAQESLVKEVERTLKSKNDYPEQIKKLVPAFSNPQTEKSAYPYFVAGKYGVDYFGEQFILKSAGQTVNDNNMGHALIDGYNYLVKALPLDSIPNEKGKVKPKYSKDIYKLVNEAYSHFDDAAVLLWGVKDYQGAYDAWELLFEAPTNPVFGANAPKSLPDSILNVISFNQGLAAYNLQDWPGALRSFDRARELGNNTKNVYDFSMAAASNYSDDKERSALIAKYAEMAYPIYGSEDNRYIGNIINNMMQQGNYTEAEDMIKKYMVADPDNAQLYFILGVVYENEENNPNAPELAIEQFKKCVELDPSHASALIQLGQLVFNKAYALDEAATGLSTAEYNKNRETVVDPTLLEAAGYFEQAYKANPEDGYAGLANLRSIYYNLNDEENMKRIEELISNH